MSKISIAIDSVDSTNGQHQMRRQRGQRQKPQNQKCSRNINQPPSFRINSINPRLTSSSSQYNQPNNLIGLRHRSRNGNETFLAVPGTKVPSNNHQKSLRTSHNANGTNSIDFYLLSDSSHDCVANSNVETTAPRTRKLAFEEPQRVLQHTPGIAGIRHLHSDIDEEIEFDDATLARYRLYGILIISFTVVYFVIGMGSIFNVWKYVFKSSSSSGNNDSDFPVDNYYAYVLLLCPAIFWIWCIVSWVGMKLFRHAKGIAISE